MAPVRRESLFEKHATAPINGQNTIKKREEEKARAIGIS